MCKYHTFVFAIYKIPQAFCRGNKGDANFRVSQQKYVIPADAMKEKRVRDDILSLSFYSLFLMTQQNIMRP